MASFSSSDAAFASASDFIKKAKSTTDAASTNEQKLSLYGLFKQTKGDVTGSQPWAVQLEARAKYDAHAALKGMTTEEAKGKYVDEVMAQIESLSLECPDMDWPKSVLIVATSATELAGDATGAWMEELAAPYALFKGAGVKVSFASISGEAIPIDAGSRAEGFFTQDCKDFDESLLATAKKLSDLDAASFSAIFFAGGHGSCVDFPDGCAAAATAAAAAGKVVAAVCHGPTALVNAKGADGEALVKGKKVCGFTDVEEGQVGKTEKVPFLLEAKLRELGADFQVADPWTSNAVADGKLVTGQNPQSSAACAKLVLEALA